MASATWKRDFASGLIVLLPVLVTTFVIVWIYNRVKEVPLPVDNPVMRVILTLVIFVLLVFSMGYLMRTTFGDLIEEGIDGIMNQLPGLRVVYNASKMAVETAVTGTEELQAPVKIEAWEGMRMTAFKTGKVTEDGRDVLFLPTAPNITTGFVVEVDPDSYVETNERVEDALTRVLSAGFGESDQTGMTAMAVDGDEETVETETGGEAAAGDAGAEAGTDASAE